MPKSCVNFQPVKDIERSLKHVHRKEEREPSHLLPKEHRRANFRVVGSLTPPQVRKRFEKRIANQTGQARSRENSSPFWEGVLLLDAPTDPHHDWSQAQAAKLRNWAKRYAEMTGHEVVQIQVHADEGYMLDGKPVYNGHAHVYVDRCNTEGRIISLSRTAMSRVQDMTAEVMGLERGETLDDRKGYRGRKHLTPNQWRDAANRAKEVGLELFEKGRAAGVAATAKIAIQEAQEASGRAERHEWYIHLRGVLKGSQRASQGHYSMLKKVYEANVPEFDEIGRWAMDNDQLDVQSLLDWLEPEPPAPAKQPKRADETPETQEQTPRKAASSNDDGPEGP